MVIADEIGSVRSAASCSIRSRNGLALLSREIKGVGRRHLVGQVGACPIVLVDCAFRFMFRYIPFTKFRHRCVREDLAKSSTISRLKACDQESRLQRFKTLPLISNDAK